MRKTIISATIVFSFLFSGCSDKEKEAMLESQINQLEQELDDCQNGADKLLAKIQIAFEKENWEDVKVHFSVLESRHPESVEFQHAIIIHESVLRLEEKQRLEAENLLKKQEEERLSALKKLKKNYDDVSGITWYKNPYFTHYDDLNKTSLYMGQRKGGKPWMILKMSYTGEDWIFFEKALLSYDGNTLEIPFNEYEDKESDNSGGKVWEWIQVSVTPEIETYLRDFCQAKSPKMRLSGKYTETRTLSYSEKKAIRDVLNGYDALKNE